LSINASNTMLGQPRVFYGVDGFFIVKGNKDKLSTGMCFSIEPMICIYSEFGVRLEDHVYMTESGPKWITKSRPLN
jgi:Xaa-Pro aminopeptidase